VTGLIQLPESEDRPQFASENKTKLELALIPEIRLRDIALLLIGGIIVGAVLGVIAVAVARLFTPSKFVAGMLAGTAFYGSCLIAVGILLRWLGIDVVPPPALDILPHNLSQLLFAIILIAIIGPLAEELIFRGLLLDWLKQKINVWAAALILSVIFALLHNNGFKLGAIGAMAFGVRMALGLASSAFAIRYRSLRASFVMHATFNCIACVASVLSQG
jgi:membrane protease YdiL (CAAX protease family)